MSTAGPERQILEALACQLMQSAGRVTAGADAGPGCEERAGLLQRAQSALDAEARYRHLLTRLDELLLDLDVAGTVIAVNDPVEALTGYRPDELVGRNWWDIFCPGELLRQVTALHERMDIADVTGYEMTFRVRDGAPVTLSLTSANLYGPDGKLAGITAVGVRVNSKAKSAAETSLRELHDRVRTLAALQALAGVLVPGEKDLPGLLRTVAALLSDALGQHRRVRIVFDGSLVADCRFTPTPWHAVVDFSSAGDGSRCIEIHATEPPATIEAVLSADEAHLLDAVATMLRSHFERDAAEDALRRSLVRLQAAQRLGRIADWQLEVDSGRIGWSDTAMSVLGSDCAAGPPQTLEQLLALYAPADAERLARSIRRVLHAGLCQELELSLRSSGGTDAFHRCVITADRDHTGRVVRLVGVVQDITWRREADLCLLREVSLSNRIINSLPGLYFLFDEHYRALRWSENLEQLTAVSAEDLATIHPLALVAEDDRASSQAAIDECMARGEASVEARVISRNGGLVPFLFSGRRIEIEGTRCISVLGLDISERQRMEAALRETRNFLEKLISYSGSPIVVWDRQLQITQFNHAFERLSGHLAADMLGRPVGTLFPEQDRQAALMEIHRIADAKDRDAAEVPIVCENGDVRLLLWTSATILAPDGLTPVATIGQGQDITARKKAEDSRRRAENERQATLCKLKKVLEDSVQAVASTLEMRDPYTAGHQRRVAVLATTIARAMSLDEAVVDGIRLGSLIHDIGKVHVPAEILCRPKGLRPMEMDLIRSHPAVGYEIVKDIDFPWPIAQMIRQHHERLDGSGYPDGLAGDAILLEARIIAVADVVEAMSSHRPYRPSLGADRALAEISNGRGRSYDAEVVDVCLSLFRERQFRFE